MKSGKSLTDRLANHNALWFEPFEDEPTVEVESEPPVEQPDTGYDVILVAGQSNAAGFGTPLDALVDVGGARVFQFDHSDVVIAGDDPLDHPTQNAGKIGFAVAFARTYAAHTARSILLVPAASNGTGFHTGYWQTGGDGRTYALAHANAAMALDAGNRFIGVLWHQGEEDCGNLTSGEYAWELDDLITDVRANVTGASSSWFILGQMTDSVINPGGVDIDAAHQNTPLRNIRCAIWQGYNDPANDIHFTAAAQRINGTSAYAALSDLSSSTTLPGQVTGLAVDSMSTTSANLSWDAPSTGAIATNYLIEYRVTGAGSWTTFSHSRSVATSGVITGLTASTDYDFRVSAVSTPGTGTPSSTATGSTSLAGPAANLNSTLKGSDVVLTNNETTLTLSTSSWNSVRGLVGHNSGAYYYEGEILTLVNAGQIQIGIINGSATDPANFHVYIGGYATGVGFSVSDRIANGGTTYNSYGGPDFFVNSILMIAYDAGTGNVWFGVDSVWQSSITPVVSSNSGRVWGVSPGTLLYPALGCANTGNSIKLVTEASFQTYAPPTGFSAWG